jgi:biotin carboxylase
VKPTALAGSRGVFLWHSPQDAQRWTELVDGYAYEGPFLVEEYLRGPEYSVETLSRDGRHQVVGITQKQLGAPPLFVEVGHLHPAPLPNERRRSIEDLTTTFLTACGYQFGPAHTEVIWTAGGPRIVESQARLGGDRIPRLIELSGGLDIERAVFSTMAGRLPAAARHTASALVRFFTVRPGHVDGISGLVEARQLDYVDELRLRLAPGDTAAPVRDSASRHGHLIVSGASPEQALARCEEVLTMIEVVVDGVPTRLDGRLAERTSTHPFASTGVRA